MESHLFRALFPNVLLSCPQGSAILTKAEVVTALRALKTNEQFLPKTSFSDAIQMLGEPATPQMRRKLPKLLGECEDCFRSELYKPHCKTAYRRLQVHQSLMAAGYYQRCLTLNGFKGGQCRFLFGHYSNDVRQDDIIKKEVKSIVLKGLSTTGDDHDGTLRDVLLIERKLFGSSRLSGARGRRWLFLGIQLKNIAQTEEELRRILDIPAVKEFGHFTLQENEDSEKNWKTLTVGCAPEPERCFLERFREEVSGKKVADADLVFKMRVQKPKPPPSWQEALKEKILRLWVIAFAAYLMFWAVDEEVITLVMLLIAKYKQTRAIQELKDKNPGMDIYIARSGGT